MNRTRILGIAMLLAVIAFLIPASTRAEVEPFKWYGIGGELNGSRRWLGRIGITKSFGAEVAVGMDWESGGSSFIELGAGVIYDYAPTSDITPFTMCRFILHRIDNGESKSRGRIEVGGGVEYIIKQRIGISAELNFGVSLDPSRVMTTTLLRAYFYL